MIKVLVNGYGTIGKRVADAVAKQDDMQLAGIVKLKPDFKSRIAAAKGYHIFAEGSEGVAAFDAAGQRCSGTLREALEGADAVIDCTPGKTGAQNKALYASAGKSAVFQGGESAGIADVSFVAQCNYAQARGKKYVRVVSCNTTGLCRTLGAINAAFGVESANVVLVRRAADPGQVREGPINAIVPDPAKIPSHHGPDVQSVLPISITTAALKIPTTLMHVHVVFCRLKRKCSAADAINALESAPRVMLVSTADDFASTAHLIEYARDLGRSRGDLYEIPVWRESISVNGGGLAYMQAVHQECNVVPENVDAIRAMFDVCSAEESIKKTNASLGISK